MFLADSCLLNINIHLWWAVRNTVKFLRKDAVEIGKQKEEFGNLFYLRTVYEDFCKELKLVLNDHTSVRVDFDFYNLHVSNSSQKNDRYILYISLIFWIFTEVLIEESVK